MNALENKAVELAIKELQDTVADIEKLKHRLDFLTDEKCDVKETAEKLEDEIDKIVCKKLNSVNEWLWALKNNATR